MEWVSLSDLLQGNWLTAALVFAATILFLSIKAWLQPGEAPVDLCSEPQPCGEITLSELGKYDGRDYTRPLYIAVKGSVFDVSTARDFYGPGMSLSVTANRLTFGYCLAKAKQRAASQSSLIEECAFFLKAVRRCRGKTISPGLDLLA